MVTLCWDSFHSLKMGQAFLKIQFASFSPYETREVDDLCCHSDVQTGVPVSLSYTNCSEATLSLTQGGITRGARCSTSYHFYLNCFSRNVRGSANNVVSAQFASVEALQWDTWTLFFFKSEVRLWIYMAFSTLYQLLVNYSLRSKESTNHCPNQKRRRKIKPPHNCKNPRGGVKAVNIAFGFIHILCTYVAF